MLSFFDKISALYDKLDLFCAVSNIGKFLVKLSRRKISQLSTLNYQLFFLPLSVSKECNR